MFPCQFNSCLVKLFSDIWKWSNLMRLFSVNFHTGSLNFESGSLNFESQHQDLSEQKASQYNLSNRHGEASSYIYDAIFILVSLICNINMPRLPAQQNSRNYLFFIYVPYYTPSYMYCLPLHSAHILISIKPNVNICCIF